MANLSNDYHASFTCLSGLACSTSSSCSTIGSNVWFLQGKLYSLVFTTRHLPFNITISNASLVTIRFIFPNIFDFHWSCCCRCPLWFEFWLINILFDSIISLLISTEWWYFDLLMLPSMLQLSFKGDNSFIGCSRYLFYVLILTVRITWSFPWYTSCMIPILQDPYFLILPLIIATSPKLILNSFALCVILCCSCKAIRLFSQ